MDMFDYLKLTIKEHASDLFISVGAPATIKVGGVTRPVGDVPLTSEDVAMMARSIMNDAQQREFEETMELNMALSLDDYGRFRINVFRQRGEVAMVARYILGVIPSIAELNLPPVLSSIVMEERGLILIVGSTGSGKSTTLASMIDFRNTHHSGHILTIEDPIEFIHRHKQSIVDQREVGIDTLSYDNALKNAMREAPDVILIGEIRDRATMKNAIAYAETGHLCLSTLHANNANQAMERVINFFHEDAKSQLLFDLSLNLKAVISLRLIPGIHQLRIPVAEVLINSPYVAALIEKGKIDDIKEVMERSHDLGMQTFDQDLLNLYKKGHITQENAIRFADSKNNVSLKIRLTEDGLGDKPTDLKIDPEDD